MLVGLDPWRDDERRRYGRAGGNEIQERLVKERVITESKCLTPLQPG